MEKSKDNIDYERAKKELLDYSNIVRKVLESKVLTKRESTDVCTMFMIIATDEESRVLDNYGDYLYNKLLELSIKLYP